MSEFNEMLASWRHDLHMHPETAFEEERTAAFVAQKLREFGIEDVVEHVGKTGVVATLKVGTGKKIIGLRADMDALNLPEENADLPYKSVYPGKMHGCGHDGHTVSLLGAAKLLAESRDFDGTVRFVFQPAEEPGHGAQAMIDDGFYDRFPLDEFYSLHNNPNLPFGTLNTTANGIMASEDNFKIVIKGVGGHASSPQWTNDALVVASEIILALQTIVSRNADPLHPVVVSCTEMTTNGAHNAIPGCATITGDCRAFSVADQQLIENRMRTICESICKMNGSECEFTYTHEFAPTINDAHGVDVLASAAKAVLGEENVNTAAQPACASEDFGRFLMDIPGCYGFIGSGAPDTSKYPPLHNPHFNYNDDVLEMSANIFASIIRQQMPKE